MPNILGDIQKYFNQSNLYDLLGVSKNATKAEIKKAYYKLSISTHPDKVDEDLRPEATIKFQILGRVYFILNDDNLRAVYDDTGAIDEENESLDEDKDWFECWRLIFPKVTISDIEKFEKNYKRSQDEVEDLKKIYLDSKGDIEAIMESMMCSLPEDEQRYRDIIDNLIKNKELKMLKGYKNEDPKKKKARLSKAAKEEKEAAKMLEEMKKKRNINGDSCGGGEDSLSAMILQNKRKTEQDFNNFVSNLEAKYSKGESKTSSKKGKSTSSNVGGNSKKQKNRKS